MCVVVFLVAFVCVVGSSSVGRGPNDPVPITSPTHTKTPPIKTGMEGVCEKGLARNIGVSNFNAQAVMDLMK